jgi:excisionase family DNA binding protein
VKLSKTATRNVASDAPEPSLCDGGMVTVVEASKFLSISRSTLYQLMGAGLILYARIGTRRLLPKRALVEFAERSLVTSEAA